MSQPPTNNEARFDDPARWWFLTKDGFSHFRCDPVAQGYEILSRHPDFPHLLTRTEDGEQITTWDHGNKHLPRPTWKQLDAIARRSFLFDYKFELHRMGLLEIAWLVPAAITFNCTEGVDSILAAAHCWLAHAGLFRRAAACGEHWRTRWPTKSPDQPDAPLKASIGYKGNPDIVTISWGHLIKARKDHPFYGCSDNVVAALRTFLEHNTAYRRHRKKRLAVLRRWQQRLKMGIKKPNRTKIKENEYEPIEQTKKNLELRIKTLEAALKNSQRRLEKTSESVIALGCVASDCQREGRVFDDVDWRAYLPAIRRKKSGLASNHLRQLRKLQDLSGCFRKNRQIKGRAKRVPHVAEPVSVVATLFPGFRAKN